jgi:exodeoxyribonuclease V beta subunit
MKTSAAEAFDLLNSPLQGSNLIEASAGTGKTFAIAGIFLRLLLDESRGKPLTVRQILVVTYTVAATEELRDRIRGKIHEALAAFARSGSDDAFLDGVVKRHPSPLTACGRLKAALCDFDEASIHTIHGFCQRTLHEHAFESGSPFATDFVSDEKALREEVVRDFWRCHFYETAPEFVAHALERKADLPSFLALIQPQRLLQDMTIVPATEPAPLASLAAFRDLFGQMKEAWGRCRAEVLDAFAAPALNKKLYGHADRLLTAMDRYLAAAIAVPVCKELARFTASGIAAGRKTTSKEPPPRHPFFDLCERFNERSKVLAGEMDRQLLHLQSDIFRYVREEMPIRKRRRQILSFNDLLVRLRDAVLGSADGAIGDALRSRYRAALIDEFQDTDPVQYAIFRNVFHHPDSILFLVGDPKQAIYSFRGADLFAYLSAEQEVDRRYTLTSNWRSEPSLIRAVNAVFTHPANAGNPFLQDRIAFHPAVAAPVEDRKEIAFSGEQPPPLAVWRLDNDGLQALDAAGNKDATRKIIASAVAAEIARLLQWGRERKALIHGRPVQEADIAVLVRDKYDARKTQDALRGLGIPSVLHSAGNVFDSDEAEEMERIMAGIAEPGSEKLFRAALATRLLGVSGETLENLKDDEARWEDGIARFLEYGRHWERYGFLQMFRSLMLKEDVRRRLLSLSDGERRLTNVLHLSEILHTASAEQKLGMAGLVKWLARQRDPETDRSEEHELRLESDADAVKIVTIHKSKGLQYAIVFCPFNWGSSRFGVRNGHAGYVYHERDETGGGWKLKLSLDRDDATGRSAAERESLAENIRLLYVALTRAEHRCYLVWGKLKDAETSSLAYVLHPPPEGDRADILSAMEARYATLDDEGLRRELEDLELRSDGAIAVSDLPAGAGVRRPPAPEASDRLTCRTFSRVMDRSTTIASYSHFVDYRDAGQADPAGAAPELPDRDAGTVPVEQPSGGELTGLFAFPRGKRAGNLLHDIFETIDFTDEKREATEALVTAKLADYGFDEDWRDTLCAMIRKVLAAPLDPSVAGLSLSRIGRQERLSEMQFFFPLKRVTADRLKTLFSGAGGPATGFSDRMARLTFNPAEGFMKGYVDLVFRFDGRFYLLDWKSNFLGGRFEDYGDDPLRKAMHDDCYILQYHIYVLALHRYLAQRLPGYEYDRHFGGVFYVFLRGVDPEQGPGCGIYRDRPEKPLILSLDDALIDVSGLDPCVGGTVAGDA